MTNNPVIKPNWVVKTIAKALPSWTKRTTLLASFAAQYAKIDPSNTQAVRTLNKVLSLTTHDSGLQLPFLVSSMVWTESPGMINWLQHVKTTKDTSDLMDYADLLVEQIPDWFSYASREEMVMDFTNLFKQLFVGHTRVGVA
jgi:hypothetical protein